MPATVEIDEANGAGETITHGITNSNMGSADSVNLNPTANPITAGNRSFIKYQKIHVTAMGGSAQIDTLLGIGGSLSGSLIAVGSSDYLGHQLITDVDDTAGASTTMNYQYREIA
jgi:hypothetical protein